MLAAFVQKKKKKHSSAIKCVLFAIECTSISHKNLDICYYELSFLWSCNKAPQLNVGKSWKRLFFVFCFLKKNKNTITPFFVMHINSNTLFCKSYIIYNIRQLLCTVKCPKVYFSFFPLHILTLYKIPYIYMLQMQVTFLELDFFFFFLFPFFFTGHLLNEGFFLKKLCTADTLRWDATHTSSTFTLRMPPVFFFPLPGSPCQSRPRRLRINRLDMR